MAIASFDLTTLNGSNGFSINGEAIGGQLGYSVSSAGDINGDGFDDLIIGVPSAETDASNSEQRDAGQVFVVFGQGGTVSPTLDLADLDGSNGFRIDGLTADDRLGFAVSSAGDVNGDGVDDLLLGSPGRDVGGEGSGGAFVVFGRDGADTFDPTLDLDTLDGETGFELLGVDPRDLAGSSVTDIGDFNGDGIDDIAIGAARADLGSIGAVGEVYVVYGTNNGFPSTLDLANLGGDQGFTLRGVNTYDYTGFSINSAGDVNGDGLDDLIIGAQLADPSGRNEAGSVYVVFGDQGGIGSNVLNLESLLPNNGGNGSRGFVLNGLAADDYTGFSVSGAGDVSGDGLDDLLIGAPLADPDGVFAAGVTYVLFGQESFPASPSLTSLDGTNGFLITSPDPVAQLGTSVSEAGDVNGDGIDDLVVAAPVAAPDGTIVGGEVSVIFGKRVEDDPFQAEISTFTLIGNNGFGINGLAQGDLLGSSVSGAGDLNGDGLDDLIIGAPEANNGAGATYVVYGSRNFATTTTTTVDELTIFDLNSDLTPADLAQFLGGSGVRIENVTFQGDNRAAGLFLGGNRADLPISSGIVLSTGNVADIVGPNVSNSTGSNLGVLGDADLDSQIFNGVTADAAVLEFSLTPQQEDLTFQFVFASEEYDELLNTNLNDIFGVFVDGVNVALTSDPVLPRPISAASAPAQFDNTLPDAPFNIEFDGFTAILTVTTTVTPLRTIPIKVAIADVGDALVDSAVFLSVGGISTDVPDIGALGDTALTRVNQSVTIDVLANDLLPEGVTVEFAFFDTTTRLGGRVALDNRGTPNNGEDDRLIYTPLAGFSGTDTFTYGIEDQAGNLAVASVNVLVNTPPQLADFSKVIDEGTVAVFSPNDFFFSDADGDDPVEVQITSLPDEGTLLLNQRPISRGQLIPFGDLGALTYLPPSPGFAGITGFTWNASDGVEFAEQDAVAEIKVTDLPEPFAAVDDEFIAFQDTPVIVDVLANDTDGLVIALGDTQTDGIGFPDLDGFVGFFEVGRTAANGYLILDKFTQTLIYIPPVGYAGLDNFTYVARGVGAGGNDVFSNVADVTIQVANVIVGDPSVLVPILTEGTDSASQGSTNERLALLDEGTNPAGGGGEPANPLLPFLLANTADVDSVNGLLINVLPQEPLDEEPLVPVAPIKLVRENLGPSDPLVFIDSGVFVNEGSEAVFTVSLATGSPELITEPVTVSFTTSNGDATPEDNDFEVVSGTLTFLPGEATTQTITVPVLTDSEDEETENFFVELSNVTGGGATFPREPERGTATILGNEGPIALIENAVTTEGEVASFTIRLSEPIDEPVSFRVSVNGDTATQTQVNNGVVTQGDFSTGIDLVVSFDPNETSKTFSVATDEDSSPEDTEFFSVTLLAPDASPVQIGRSSAIGVILDDEPRIGGLVLDSDGDYFVQTDILALVSSSLEADLEQTGLIGQRVSIPITILDPNGTLLDTEIDDRDDRPRLPDPALLESVDITLAYDTTLLDLTEADVTLGDAFSGYEVEVNVNEAAGQISLGIFARNGEVPLTQTGALNLANLNFLVANEAISGEASLVNIVDLQINEGTRLAQGLGGTVNIQSFEVVNRNPANFVTSTGVLIRFNDTLDPVLELFDSSGEVEAEFTILQRSSVLLLGPSGPVEGSVFWDGAQSIEFVRTGELPLEPGDYQLTLFDTGFVTPPVMDARGAVIAPGVLLDGNRDGVPGGNFVRNFTVSAPPERVLSLPDIVRAPGQGVDVPANDADQGLPVRLSEAAGVTELSFTLLFDPNLLAVSGINLGPDVPGDWDVTEAQLLGDRTVVTVGGSTPLTAGTVDVVFLDAAVPSTAPYGSSQVVKFSDISLEGTTDEVLGDAAFQQVALLGDATRNGTYSSQDAFLISRLSVGLGSEFSDYPLIDPVLIGDVNGSGSVTGTDASIVARQVVGLNPAVIP